MKDAKLPKMDDKLWEKLKNFRRIEEEQRKKDLEEFKKGVKNDGLGDTGSDDKIKYRWDLIYWPGIEEIAKVYTEGSLKYGENQWQNVEEKRYIAALFRHMYAYLNGEIYDKDAKHVKDMMHMAQVAWNALSILYKIKERENNEGK